jgi:hypothetical protein
MAKKKPEPVEAEKRVDNSGIPVIAFDAAALGVCPVCYQSAHVSTHRRNGYFLRCVSCGLTLFTRSPVGSITFRAQQEVLSDASLRETLQDLNAQQFPRYVDTMIRPATP